MTPEEAKARLAKIREHAEGADSEAAHQAEDAMRAEVLHAIVDGSAVNPALLAGLALSSSGIPFDRPSYRKRQAAGQQREEGAQ